MAKRQVGKCEAIYRAIPTMHLQGANIGCTFVQSGYPRNQSKFLRKVNKGFESEQPSDEIENDSENDDNNDNDNIEDNEAMMTMTLREHPERVSDPRDL